ncbi:PREDICTED: uncharacterized protein C12orf50 homolog [Calidris pugnax]|uniref:uncharacterized protein C12orf50 homolog n=1 Tax=Calidris pugnax TaxID=198806 RepID=UPI00071DFE85|nr:PREDICTED: uncharacterized protein C12orf50 homolog [Calidris pugnax]
MGDSEKLRFSILSSEAMEVKEDVQATQVPWRHFADVTSWRSSWQLWKCNIPYRLSTAFLGSTSLEQVPPPPYPCILLSVRVLLQRSSRECGGEAEELEMATAENDCNFHFYSPYAQQKYRSIPCFWETQPSGCVRISCAFHHSKPRYINGLFLPPSNNAPLQQGVQEEILQPAHCQESLRKQEVFLRPIHPPLIINLNDEEDEEDDEEQENYVSTWVPKSAADVEEERAIKEICYKSGEYYKTQYPHEHQSTKTVSSPQENEVLPLVATKQDLQKGDGNTITTKINNIKREEGSSGSRAPRESIPRTDCRSVENGEKKHTELVKDHHCKEVKKKWISEDPRNLPNTVTGKAVREPYSQKSSKPLNQLDANRRFWTQTENYDKYNSGSYYVPTWRKRNPRAKTFSKFKTAIQSQENMEVNRKGQRYVEKRKRLSEHINLQEKPKSK